MGKNNKPSLNERRRLAVQMRLDGAKIADIAEKSQLSAPTIISAHKNFLAGGWPAVDAQPRGRKAGNLTVATDTLDQINAAALQTPTGNGTWTLPLLETHCRQSHGTKVGARSLGTYLNKWGIGAPSLYALCKKSGEQLDWLNTRYADFCSTASDNKAAVFWMGRQSAEHKCQSFTVVYAHNTRGKYHWLAGNGSNHAQLATEFLERLAHDSDGPIAIVLDDASLLTNASFQQHLQSQTLTTVVASPAAGISPAAGNNIPPAPAETTNKPITPSKSPIRNTHKMSSLTHLQRLEAESIHIMREVVANADKPVMLYSIGKDSAVMLHLAMKAFYPAKPPFALMHVDTGWKFKEMYEFRDKTVKKLGLDLFVYKNPEGVEKDVNPFTHGTALHTDIMKTQALRQALDKYKFDCAFGGARRDEEASRAKERIFSFRTPDHFWDPKNQRPELWNLYNTKKMPGESIRVFPISNWTELDVWQYIHQENIPVVPLYFAAKRPVVERDGQLLMVDDERMPMNPGEAPLMKSIRFRTLGCYPLTAAVESTATTVPEIIRETLTAAGSERQGRMIDHDSDGSMELKKQEGYF